jgi:hypothetical protein
MLNEKSLNLKGDILFLGKKIKCSNKAIAQEKNKKNKFKIYNNKKYLTRPITQSEYLDKNLSNFNVKKENNKIFQSSFCFICGSLVKYNEYKYLLNPLQKLRLTNELKKIDLILAGKREEILLNEEQSFSEVRFCNKCHLTYYIILKLILKQEYENNITNMKNNQIENQIRKSSYIPEIYNNNYSNGNKNLQLLNNNIQNNSDIALNNSNEGIGINDIIIVDNNKNILDDIISLGTILNENIIDIINNDINKNGNITDINRNYKTFINSANNKILNDQIDKNNLIFKVRNLNLNDISLNLNKSFGLNNNLNFAPQIQSFIQNSSNNNISQLNNINLSENINQGFETDFFKNNAINIMENDDLNTFLNDQNIKQKNILINDNNTNNNNNTNNSIDQINHIFQLIKKYFVKYDTFNNEIKCSLIDDIENLIGIFSQVLSEFKLKKNFVNLSQKLNGENENKSEIRKKDEKINKDKCLQKENTQPNFEQYYDLIMKDILKAQENIKYKINGIKIFNEIKNEYIITLLKNIDYLYNSCQNKIKNQDNNLILDEINKKIKQPNNESNSNSQFNGFIKENMDNLYNNIYNNLFQMNKLKNHQD